MKLRDLLCEAEKTLRAAGIDDPAYDARELLKAASDLSTESLLLALESDISSMDEGVLREFAEKTALRANHMPLQRILKKVWFMGLPFGLSDATLIPRQDTEILAETVLARERDRNISVLDLGTGTGAIAVSLKVLGGYRRVAASDISAGALSKAMENADMNGAAIDFLESDLFENIEGVFDVIVSNPPYIPTGVIASLREEVRDHEPLIALDGGADGLSFYRRIADGIRKRHILAPGGRIYLEIGFDEAEAAGEIFESVGFSCPEVLKDLSGRDRVITAKL